MPSRRSTKLDPEQQARRLAIGEERRAKTRATLLAAAYRLFAAHGSDAPTIDDVIAEAGVARGTFYNHFATRDELFRAVASDLTYAINGMITPAIAGITDPATQISLSYRLFLRFAISDPTRGWILLRTMPLVSALNDEMKFIMQAQFSQAIAQRQFTVQSLETAMDLGLGLLVMTINRALHEGITDKYIDQTVETLLTALGLSKKEARSLAQIPIDLGPPLRLAINSIAQRADGAPDKEMRFRRSSKQGKVVQ
ncbi:TetR/AcrR family transcriptional regulator [Paraburkholderia sp. BCC1884]|uniref:TetR/AcrR family transcriptional regulator n=1 Tax=Paraburkholderia sp. BCC1884 TaxID=2562668 RepID=UPI0016432A5A|nr:TetR/AcrR family transcriptional regulator [Paraburkholderia sp. BCC1884]